MRAAVYHGRGDVRVEAVSRPADPHEGELLLEVTRAAICGSDAAEFANGPKLISLDRAHPGSGHIGPVTLGHEFVGRVATLGDGVHGLAVGDRVVSGAGVSCGRCERCREGRTNLCESYYTLGFHRDGGLAEAVVSPAHICVKVPDECDDDAAAMAQPFAVALHALNRVDVSADDSLSVIGCGGVGALVVAAAVGRGNRRVIAVDIDRARLDAAAALGAAEVVDATVDDPVHAVRDITGGLGADVAIDAAGAPGTLAQAQRCTRNGGRVLLLGLPAQPPELDSVDAILRELDLRTTVAHVCDSDLPEALDLLSATDVADKVVERVIGLKDIVAGGLVPLAEGTARGKILVDVGR
jgi:(R,R)-butanediol dehydrogenase/meso-butanediol dehydrogenase/diacetyl reductase